MIINKSNNDRVWITWRSVNVRPSYKNGINRKIKRFRDEQLNYLQYDREYKKDKNERSKQIETEYAKSVSKYNPWGKPGKDQKLQIGETSNPFV